MELPFISLNKEVALSLQTEFEFTLPRGFIDKDGNLHRKGTMRLANAKDEITPLSDRRVQENRAYLVILLLSRVITRLGTLPLLDENVIENLFSTDLAFLQDFYRRINEEGSSKVKTTCPECGKSFDIDMGTALGE